jgi:LPXTG-motif cell wall-anchored protein
MAQPVQPAPVAEPEATTGESRDREALAPAVAEAATPPESPPATQTPAQQPPAELPKTASLYPLIGLSGAVLLGFAGLLRLKRRV